MPDIDQMLGGLMNDAAGVPKAPTPPKQTIEPHLDVQKTKEDRINDIVALSGVSREDLAELFGSGGGSTTIIEAPEPAPIAPPLPIPPPQNVAPMQLPPGPPPGLGGPGPGAPGLPPGLPF